ATTSRNRRLTKKTSTQTSIRRGRIQAPPGVWERFGSRVTDRDARTRAAWFRGGTAGAGRAWGWPTAWIKKRGSARVSAAPSRELRRCRGAVTLRDLSGNISSIILRRELLRRSSWTRACRLTNYPRRLTRHFRTGIRWTGGRAGTPLALPRI